MKHPTSWKAARAENRYYIAHAAIAALAKEGRMTGKEVGRVIKQ